YRAKSLEYEFELARSTLVVAGVAVTTEFEAPRLDPTQENVLCLALREGVTNVVRHAHAKRCRLAVKVRQENCLLEIQDDGERAAAAAASEGGAQTSGIRHEGSGLTGMRERVAQIGGSVTEQVDRGTKLTIRLPLMPREA